MIDLILEMAEQRLFARVAAPTGETVFQTLDRKTTIYDDRGIGADSGGDCYVACEVRAMALKALT